MHLWNDLRAQSMMNLAYSLFKFTWFLKVHVVAYATMHHCYDNPNICRLWNAPANGEWLMVIVEAVSSIAKFHYLNLLFLPSRLDFSTRQLLTSFACKPKWACNDNTHFCAVHSFAVNSMVTFLMGHTANFAIKMIQESNKISSWMQKCVDFSGIFVFQIGQKQKSYSNFLRDQVKSNKLEYYDFKAELPYFKTTENISCGLVILIASNVNK